MDAELAIAVAEAGGLGSLPVAMLMSEQVRDHMAKFRAATDKPVNLNFFCHKLPVPNNAREHAWREALKPYYVEFGIDPAAPVPASNRMPFDADAVRGRRRDQAGGRELPFWLAGNGLIARVKARAALSSPRRRRSPRRAGWKRTAAMPSSRKGYEAGGHRGMFLTDI